MLPRFRPSTSPGEILSEEFLQPMGISVETFAIKSGIPVDRLHRIIQGKESIRNEDAERIGPALGTTAEFWINLQNNYDQTK